MTDIENMTREERREWLAETKPRHDLAELIRAHQFSSSRPWPDGTRPTAPNWNPGCKCSDEIIYFFQHDDHLAEVILAAGWKR